MIKLRDIKERDIEIAIRMPDGKYLIIIKKIKSDNPFLYEFILKVRKDLKIKNKAMARGFLNISCQLLTYLSYIPLVDKSDFDWATINLKNEIPTPEIIEKYRSKYSNIFALIYTYLKVAMDEKIINESDCTDFFSALFYLLLIVEKADRRQFH